VLSSRLFVLLWPVLMRLYQINGSIQCATACRTKVVDVSGQAGGGLREELDVIGNELRRVGASLRGSIENLVNLCSFTFSPSNLTAAAGKPLQIGHRRIKVYTSQTHARICLAFVVPKVDRTIYTVSHKVHHHVFVISQDGTLSN